MNEWMALALTEAKKAFARDEVPVGAVVVYQGRVIAQQGNQVEAEHNPMAHAEMLVLKQACEFLGDTRLTECDLYVTLEPCPMCAYAISLARIRRLYFAAYDPKGGGVEHGPCIFHSTSCHHKPEIYGGIAEREAQWLLKEFFQLKRSNCNK
ncbi:MAG: nucleoside deaminase [Alphaproteobacteria bacterium]|nr:nucleoside deaminase [Alphaproteobacteria bacterium]